MRTDYSHIICRIEPEVATITLNRPPLNIMNIAMMEELCSALDQISDNEQVKLVVLDHEGKAFSAGVDIKDHTPDKVERMMELFHRVFRLLEALEPPSLAVVGGAALGGGCELAVYCDMVVASAQAMFGQPEIKVGVFPPVAAAVFPRLIGRNRALELVLTGEAVGADQAKHMGLINQVFPAQGFRRRVDEFIARLRSLSGPVLRLAKRAVDQGLYVSVDAAICKAERIYLDELMQTEDAREGLQAFVQKRKPAWNNK